MAPPLELFLGPLLVLVCIALTCVFRFDGWVVRLMRSRLFGVTCAQVYEYWITYGNDPRRLKGLVLALL